MNTNNESIKPWYKQFWPWFLISLPMSAVIGSLITINLALTDKDGLVKDDYYKQGLAINVDLARRQFAKDLGIEADINFDYAGKQLVLTFNDAAIGKLDTVYVDLIHPTRSHQDHALELTGQDGKTFTVQLPESISPGYWWVRVSPLNKTWSIEGRIRLPDDSTLTVK
ncbi:MAG: FixH family protein [Chromatiales bacterium]|jgi:hypothetical protein